MPEWHIICVSPSRQRAAVEALRKKGFDVVWLWCFTEVLRRSSRHVKRKQVMHRVPAPALEEYLFVQLTRPGDWDRILTGGLGIRRLPYPTASGFAPRLSKAGIAFLENPPDGLFLDSEVPRPGGAVESAAAFCPGDRVGLYACAFAGYRGEVIAISPNRVKVQLKDALFAVEVPVEHVAKEA